MNPDAVIGSPHAEDSGHVTTGTVSQVAMPTGLGGDCWRLWKCDPRYRVWGSGVTLETGHIIPGTRPGK